MKKIILTIIILLLLLCSPGWAGVAHYADLSDAGSTNQGTFAEPFNTIALINAHAFATGDDLYFKAGTDEIVATYLNIDWIGTSGDRVIIGAYDGDGDFDITGSALPFLDGNYAVPAQYYGLIDIYKGSGGATPVYITIQDIRVNRSKGHGIAIRGSWNNYATDIIIDGCFVNKVWGGGINVSRGQNVTIQSCTVKEAGYDVTGSGYGPQASIAAITDQTSDVTISNNTVYGCTSEGIGLYGEVHDSVVEYNTVYDCRNVGIYVTGSHNNVIRYNLVYESTVYNTAYGWSTGDGMDGIWLHNENAAPRDDNYGHSIYGNLVAGTQKGLHLGQTVADMPELVYDNKFYNNTVVDCDYNIYFTNAETGWSSNEFKNNISYTLSGGVHIYPTAGSPTSVTWAYNCFDDAVTGNANDVTNATEADPGLVKTSGWQSLTAGAVDGSDFALLVGSNCIDAGTNVGVTYSGTLNLDNSDFTAFTFELLNQNDHGPGWDIGADIYQDPGDDPPKSGLRSKFDLGAVLREETTDDDAFWTDNGTVQQSATVKQGDRSLFLDEDNSEYLTRTGTTDDYGIATSGEFTICFWVRPLDLTTTNYLVNKGRTIDDDAAYLIQIEADDTVSVSIGYGANSDTWETLDHNNALTINQWYYVCWAHDISAKTNLVRIYDDTGSAILGSDYTTNSTNAMTGHSKTGNLGIGANNVGGQLSDILLDKFSVSNWAMTAVEMDESREESWDAAAISVQGMSAACANLTAAGTMTWAIGWDREPHTEGGAWTITATFDYPVAAQTMSYVGKWNAESGWTNHTGDIWKKTSYIEPTSVKAGATTLTEDDGNFATLAANKWDWASSILYVNVGSDPSDDVITPSPWETYVAIDTLAGWRQDSFGDAQISADITLPTGVTMTDIQDVAAVVANALTGLGTYPGNTVAIGTLWSVGTSKDYDSKTAFDAALYTVAGDEYNIYGTMTEDQNWSVNGTSALHIVLRFMEMAVTGDLTISGDYYDVYDSSKYITGTRTDSGGYNTWCSNISGGTMGMGMGAGMGASVIADDTP